MKASVIVSIYNNFEDLKCLLPSLENQILGEYEMEVIIRDDGSTDNAHDWIKSNFPGIRLIKGENKGFSRSNNIAAKHATGDALVFVNADTILDSKFVAAGLTALEEEPDAGGVNSNMIMPWVMPKQDFIKGVRPGSGYGYFLSKYGFAVYRKTNFVRCDTSFLTGGGCFVRRDAIGDELPFSERLWGGTSYCEDLDLSLRLIAKGWRLCFEPAAIVYHNQSSIKATGIKELVKFLKVSANRINVYAVNLSFLSFIKLLPILLWGIPWKIASLDMSEKLNKIAVTAAAGMLPLFFLLIPFWIYQNFVSKHLYKSASR